MLIIPIKEGESIEKGLKIFKKKFDKIGMVKELRNRQRYTKPNVYRRDLKQKAIYRDKISSKEEI